ncbi:MAG: DUF3127 domain-containing protein [Bacteroidota bacterium]
MSYEITGTLLEVFDEVQVSPRFKKREFVLEQNNNGFTEQIKFQLVQDKTTLIDGIQPGTQLTIAFDIKGNKWKDNYFVNLQAWKLSASGDNTSTAPTGSSQKNEGEAPFGEVPFPDNAPEDDLPF